MNENRNPLFSYRIGVKQNKSIQVEDMDSELRNRLWNVLSELYFSSEYEFKHDDKIKTTRVLINDACDRLFKRAVGKITIHNIQKAFYLLKWNEVYDLIEFVLSYKLRFTNISPQERFNQILKEESSGYRVIKNLVTPITNSIEINEITKAQRTHIQEINIQMEHALRLLSDRNEPDPRNSIKESISAIESLCKKISGDHNATLGQALHKIKEQSAKLIDPHLEESIQKLYKFSNDSSGVRHAVMDGKSEVDSDDARFVLVTCSAIINYLIVRYQHI